MTLKRKKEIDTSQEEVALDLIHKGAIVEVFKLSEKSGGQASVSVKLMVCTQCYRGYLYCSFPEGNKEKGKKERVYSFPVDVLRSHFKSDGAAIIVNKAERVTELDEIEHGRSVQSFASSRYLPL